MGEGPISTLVNPVTEAITRHQQGRPGKTPREREFVRAGRGMGLVALAIYFAVAGETPLGFDYGRLLVAIVRNHFTMPLVPMAIVVGPWLLVILGGMTWFLIGWSRSRGPRDMLVAVRALCAVALGGAMQWLWIYHPSDDADFGFFVQGFLTYWLTSSVTRFALAIKGPGNALKDVKKQKAHGDISLASEKEARAAKLIGPDPESAIRLGRHGFEGKGGVLAYAGERHLLLIGPNGSGKATRVLIPDLLTLKDRSLVVIDPKGELASVTADYRRTVGDVVILNPFDVLGLGSAGFNPLAALDPAAPSFVDDAAGLGEALIRIEGKDPHWPESAQALLVALLMWEVKTARKAGRIPSLERVRALLTEPDEWESVEGDNGRPQQKQVAGLRVTAARMAAAGGFEIESLAGRFLRETDEISNIQSTADTQTRWLLSPAVRTDLAKDGITFADLKKKPTTVYVVLPAERMRTHSVWLRLVIVSALRSLYHPGGLPVLFMLDEFAQLGHLGPIEDAFGLVRGYGVQLWPILQDLNQLKELYKERAETFIANAGVVQCFGPNDLNTAGWMSRRAGETTIVASGFNQNVSGNANEGVSYQQAKRPLFLPQELIDLPAGAGLLWQAGIAKAFPFLGHPYWEITECRKRAKPNPYYRGPG
ncbi:MAG TPA: type IV secretory system conjugative DNA transfer family protein [Stellaceae bacterium]|nr:type IV secretory system conjugative DNA transfer family protein [Stellaceae bacterium]